MFDYGKFQTSALAAVAAIVLTAISVGAAVGPARQIETSPVYAAAADQTGRFA